jgi:hypothetical protein
MRSHLTLGPPVCSTGLNCRLHARLNFGSFCSASGHIARARLSHEQQRQKPSSKRYRSASPLSFRQPHSITVYQSLLSLHSRMDPNILHVLRILSRQVRGKTGAMPIEYFELCRCHSEDYSSPMKGISGKDLVAAANQGCLTCKLVHQGLETALGTAIDEEYNVNYKLKKGIGLKIQYMLRDDWKTRKTYQVYAAQGASYPCSGRRDC